MTRGQRTLLLLLFLGFIIVIYERVRENLVAVNPTGICVTPHGNFGIQRMVLGDNGVDYVMKCVAASPEEKHDAGEIKYYKPCLTGTTLTPLYGACFPAGSAGATKVTDSAGTEPGLARSSGTVSSTIVSSASQESHIPPDSLGLYTPCHNLRNTAFNSACIQQFGPGYGYQFLLRQGCPLGQAKAFCSRAYRSGVPLYEERSTDCYPFEWGTPKAVQQMRKMNRRCRQYYGDGYSAFDTNATGCPAPNYARAICKT